MAGKTVYMYVPDNMADWEPGYAMAELKQGSIFRPGVGPFEVRTFSLSGGAEVSMGGIRISPDMGIGGVTPSGSALLLLPGSTVWAGPGQEAVIELAKAFAAAGVPVAGICGATFALARAGLLDDRPHTSNVLSVLKSLCPQYKGEAFYREEPAVTGNGVITASGMAPLDFARQILKCLDVATPETLDLWYKLNSTREPRFYFELMNSLKPVQG